MSRYDNDPLARLSHCQDKLYCLYCLNMEDVGLTPKASTGLAFLLRDIAIDLKEIEEELYVEIKGAKVQEEPPKG